MTARAIAIVSLLALWAWPQPAAREIEIYSDNPVAVLIEWLTIDAEGNTIVTARRQTAIGPAVPLAFVHEDGRAVRFSYPRSSPRTYTTRELAAAKRLRLPDAAPGGELLLVVPHAVVRPVAIDIAGVTARTVTLDSGLLAAAPGLLPGAYRLTPLYEGGMRGKSTSANVDVARTTVAALTPEDVGAVRVQTMDAACGVVTQLALRAFTGGGRTPDAPALLRESPPCLLTIGGLPRGHYEVSAAGANGGIASEMFKVEPQQIADASLRPANAIVTGLVTLNGTPLSGAEVTAHPMATSVSWSGKIDQEVRTGADGRYVVYLDRRGLTMVRVAHGGFLDMRRIDAREGTTTHDVALVGGTIRVRPSSWDSSRPLEITLRGPGVARTQTWVPFEGAPRIHGGLAFGKYVVSLKYQNAPSPSGESLEVEISASKPSVEVSLDPGRKWK